MSIHTDLILRGTDVYLRKKKRSDLLVLHFYPSVFLSKDKIDFRVRCAACLLSCISIIESADHFSQNFLLTFLPFLKFLIFRDH